MSFIGNRPKLNTLKFNPRSSDPVSPIEGEVQYADGTVRPEGLHVYKNTVWTPVGSSGSAATNYVLDDSATAEGSVGSWLAYADASGVLPVDGTGGAPVTTITRTTTSADILNGTASFKITKDAVNRQGEGASLLLATDNSSKYKPMTISANYAASANFVYGSLDGVTPSDIQVFVYDVTNAALITPYPNTLDGTGKFVGQFQATSSTSYRLIFHVRSTSALAYDLFFDNVVLSQAEANFVPSDSDWVSYTPTFTGLGTPTSIQIKYRKQGPNIQIQGNWLNGTVTGATMSMSLPTGLTLSSNLPTTVGVGGEWRRNAAVTGLATMYDLATSSTLIYFTTAGLTKAVGSAAGSSELQTITFEAPIQGWTSGFTTAATVLQNVPAVFRASKSAVQSIASATSTKIVWQTITGDTTGAWDSTNNRYTVKVPGQYTVNAGLVHAASASGGIREIRVRLNGTFLYGGSEHSSTGAYVMRTNVATPPINLVVGDYIEIDAYQDTGGALNVNNEEGTYFGVYKIETPAASMNIRKVATIKDEKASGTAGGTATSGSYATRTLNTLVDPFGITSLTANQFILQPGTYRINGSAPSFYTDAHKAKLRNITNSTDTIIGTSAYSGNGAADTGQSVSIVSGVFSITVATTFEIQHRVATTRATEGFGIATTFGDVEVYTEVEIEKLL